MFHAPTLFLGLSVCIALKAYRIISTDIAKTLCQVLACAVYEKQTPPKKYPKPKTNLPSSLSRVSASVASIASMTILSATQLQKGWSTLKHSDAPVVLGAELSVVEAGVFTLGAFFNGILKWPEHTAYYPDTTYQMPAFVVLAASTLALFWRRGSEARSVVFTGALFVVAAV